MTQNHAEIRVRSVTLRDVPAICAVHRGSDGPWVDPVECAISANHRLLRPFHCCVAERGAQVVGHAEWIVDQEPGAPAPRLYLGMLQVRGDSHCQGVGRRLIEYGAELALRTGCDRLRTVPEERALGFYARCGFRPVSGAVSYRLRPRSDPAPPGWCRGRTVPRRAAAELCMRLGWVQACSAHMWELCNRPVQVAGDSFTHPCLRRQDGRAFVQLRFSDPSQALALAWSPADTPLAELLAAVLHLGSVHAVLRLLLALPRQQADDLPADAEPAGEIQVLERRLDGAGHDR